MKLSKKQTVIYTATAKSFVDFYELKCNLSGLITGQDIEVREDLCPKGVSEIFATPDDYSIDMNLHFDTKFGGYFVSVDIGFLSGSVIVTFNSDIYTDSGTLKLLNKKEFDALVSKCLPTIESFLDTLDGLKRKKPCEDNCYHNKQRKKNGGCDKMYISKSEYTPEEDARRQRIALGREQMKKDKYNF